MIFWGSPFGIYILLTDSGLFPWSLRSSSLFLGIFAEYLRLGFPLSCRLSSLFSHSFVLLLQSFCSFFHPLHSFTPAYFSFISFFNCFVCFARVILPRLPTSLLPRHPQLSLNSPSQFDFSVEGRLNSSSSRKLRKSRQTSPQNIP